MQNITLEVRLPGSLSFVTYPTITVSASTLYYEYPVSTVTLYTISDPFVYSDPSILVYFTVVDLALGSGYDTALFSLLPADDTWILITADTNTLAGFYTLNVKARYSTTDPVSFDAELILYVNITESTDSLLSSCLSIAVSPKSMEDKEF